MEIKILSNEKNLLEFEAGDYEMSILHYLVERLSTNSAVEFAAYKHGHPLIGCPTIIVKTKKGNPLNLITDELEALGKEIATCRKEFKNAVK